MDPRIASLARNLLDYSIELKPGEKVLIEAETGSEDLLVALVEETYRRGGVPYTRLFDARVQRAWLMGANRPQMDMRAAWDLRELGDVEANIYIVAGDNASELVDVPLRAIQEQRLAGQPVMDLVLQEKKWCLLRFPTPSAAQAASMSTQAFEDFCFAVTGLDYARMDKAMDPLVNLMERTDRVRVTGPGTDLSFSVKGIPVIKAAGRNNIPDGEVFTAPVKDSANGTVAFNTPSLYEGTTFDQVRLRLVDGKVIEAHSSEPEKIEQLLDTDEGARYLGEFALGVNPVIDRPMKDTLYDEKIGGSLHLTPGRSYEEADNGNRSSVHWDLVLIQTPAWGGGEIWFDETLVRKDGRFVLPELEGLNPENLL